MMKFYKFIKLKATVHGMSPQTNSSAAESYDKFDDDINDNDYDDTVNFSDFELELDQTPYRQTKGSIKKKG